MFLQKNNIRFTLLFLLLFAFLVACGADSNATVEPTADANTLDMPHEHDDNHDHADHDEHMADPDHEHDESHDSKMMGSDGEPRIDNVGGATIAIVSPAAGTVFKVGDSIVVEVEIENFELAVDGSHWHVYANGQSQGMVTGQTEKTTVRGLEPGEYMVEAYLANGSHEEFRDGGSVMITVEE